MEMSEMKAFRNWWEKLLFSNNKNFRIVAELTWRAALEEVLKQTDVSNSDSSGLKYRIIMDWINEELKDG